MPQVYGGASETADRADRPQRADPRDQGVPTGSATYGNAEGGVPGPSTRREPSANSPGAAGVTFLTREEQQAVRKQRRDRAREAKLAQTIIKNKSFQLQLQQQQKQGGGGGKKKKRRWAPGQRGMGTLKAKAEQEAAAVFDQWLGVKLAAWKEGRAPANPDGGGGTLARPPAESGVTEEIDFDPSQDEIAFPPSLSAQQRRQIHGLAMELALFHASSGADPNRHVIISRTGVFQGKILTRGGSKWYKPGVAAPVVKRFAMQPGHEAIAEPFLVALRSFHASVQLHEPGFEQWLRANAPPASLPNAYGYAAALDLEVEKAQTAFLEWPLLHEVDYEYVDTPAKLSALAEDLNASTEWSFDVEAHNARTYHGLACLLQISTEWKDYVVDPLAEGMWDNMGLLRDAFGNPNVLKVGHSIRSLDVPSLFRDFGFVIVNAVDTEEAVHALGEKQSALGKVLITAGVREPHDIAGMKQDMKSCDWRERPLSTEKLVYARCDSHYLIPLWRLLRARLLAADTFSSRQDGAEEKEGREQAALREIKRRLDEDQRREEGARQMQLPPQTPPPSTEGAGSGLVSMNGAATAAAGLASDRLRSGSSTPVLDGSLPAMSPVRSGACSPAAAAQLAREPWMSEWDDPEDCHRRERSRSGSLYRPDLESIHEGARNSAFGAGLDSAVTAAFLEDEEDYGGEVTGAGASGLGNGEARRSGGLDGGGVGGGGIAASDEDDEDEDLWEGWGESWGVTEGVEDATTSTAATATGGHTPKDEMSQSFTAGREDEVAAAAVAAADAASPASTPQEAGPVDSSLAGDLNSPPPQAGAAAYDATNTAALEDGRPAAEPDPAGVVLTDGILLMWKSLSRAHVATAVLWRPSREAKREDAHSERHFRTAEQRLKPPRWCEVNVRVYEEIFLWRDRTARRLDDGVAYVCPGDTLIEVALAMPTTVDGLRRVAVPLSPVLGNGDTPEAAELVWVVRAALGLPAEEGGAPGIMPVDARGALGLPAEEEREAGALGLPAEEEREGGALAVQEREGELLGMPVEEEREWGVLGLPADEEREEGALGLAADEEREARALGLRAEEHGAGGWRIGDRRGSSRDGVVYSKKAVALAAAATVVAAAGVVVAVWKRRKA